MKTDFRVQKKPSPDCRGPEVPAKAGSFNKASEKLFVSQPSLTSAVHDLEYELGLQIFNRTSRGITLTERGRQFCSDKKKLYGDFEKLRETYAKKGCR